MKSFKKCKHIFKSDGTIHNNPTTCEKCGISFNDLFIETEKEQQSYYEQFKEISDLI
jgi:hypothetical protein